LDTKISNIKFFPIFGHQSPGNGSVFSLKYRIRIWTQ
jgi:hypothetical protein